MEHKPNNEHEKKSTMADQAKVMGKKMRKNLNEMAEDVGDGLRVAGHKVGEATKTVVNKTKDVINKMRDRDNG